MKTKSEFNSDRAAPHGFALSELLVVIAVIAILAAMLPAALAKAREQAKRPADASVDAWKNLGLSATQTKEQS